MSFNNVSQITGTSGIGTIPTPVAPTIASVGGEVSSPCSGSDSTPDIVLTNIQVGDTITIYDGATLIDTEVALDTTLTFTTLTLTEEEHFFSAYTTRMGKTSEASFNFQYTYSASSYPAFFPQQADIKAYYKLEDVNDSSGNGYNLSNVGSVGFVSGKVDNCADLRSASSSKNLNVASDLGITGQTVSIACWVKANSVPSPLGMVLAFKNSTNCFEFYRSPPDSRWHFAKENNSYQESYTAIAITNGIWYHLVGTLDGASGTGTLYVDGTKSNNTFTNDNDTSSFTPSVDLGLKIGAGYDGDFYLDEVVFWNKCLTEGEVASLYAGY